MPKLSPNIENRVQKLPKPSNYTQAMQPLFEAVSNAFYAIEDIYGDGVGSKGKVNIRIDGLSDIENISIEISDNGIGLDKDRFEAFCEVDTAFKKEKGGKGVGRLFWLDAFREIKVQSIYRDGDELIKRSFRFELNNTEQIIDEDPNENWQGRTAQGTSIYFKGIRTEEYSDYFPKLSSTFLRYFSAHFIADFLVGNGSKVSVDINGEITQYPKEISEMVVGNEMTTETISHEKFGDLSIIGFTCKKEASTGLDGGHQLHLLANGRTVETREIDNLLGLKYLSNGEETELLFHGCVSGEYLNSRVNEGRTAFNISEKILKELSRQCSEQVKQDFLSDQIDGYKAERKQSYFNFVERYPIYGFDDVDKQLDKVPFHAKKPEDFAAGLVKHQIRHDEKRHDEIQRIIATLEQSEEVPTNFNETIIEAAKGIHESEQLALAHHVVRRKLVLEIFEKLVARIRKREGSKDDYHLEETLHSFICPMRIRGDSAEAASRSHDLWLVDERLAFTRAFSSDERIDNIIKEGGSAERPDLFIWDLAHGLGSIDPDKKEKNVDTSEPLKKVMVVEFKRPGRKKYPKPEDQVEQQITKYLAQLKNGEIESYDKTRVRIADDCVFHCYVIADIVGDLEQQLSNWETTANGEGRIRPLKNQYQGSIEVVQWADLVNDAWKRNQSTLSAIGLRRSEKILE